MARHRRIAAPIDRAGFTLLELMLVLSLLVFLAALSWPSVGLPLANQALRAAADDVRTAWARARVSAMSSGHTYVFRAYNMPEAYRKQERKGDRYRITCQVAPEASADLSPAGFGTAEPQVVEEGGPALAEDGALPEGICFVGGQTAADSRSVAASSDADSALDEGLPLGDPILFYPDGTTSTSCLRLQNEYGRCMELSLRGLTGVVTVGRVQDAQP